MAAVVTPQSEDFPRWYQDVVAKAEMADNGPVRGTMVIRPYGYAIWERMQAEMDARIKKCGAHNAYFPLFIPLDYFEREADHVEGFSPELAVVTHAGGKELDEPFAVRPTSETVIGEFMAKWVQSYRDLPLLLNQWCNVVRWELRTRLFLRSSEFLWQEGHTAHATDEDAKAYALRILHEAYESFMVDVLAMPVIVGRKTAGERFPGATNTMTCEGLMRDGKALQMGTSHELGQNFARAFDMQYLDANGQQQLCWTTSWGTSTRMVGGLIMAHGDDRGLVLPPNVAPTQCVVLLVKDDDNARDAARRLADELTAAGVRAQVDDRVDMSFGRRSTDWDLKGVPLRVEVGPRDLAEGSVVIVRRHTGAKQPVAVAEAAKHVTAAVDEVQTAILEGARARLAELTIDCLTLDEVVAAAQTGFARVPWSAVGEVGEVKLAESTVTVRCLQRPDGSVPASDHEPDLVAFLREGVLTEQFAPRPASGRTYSMSTRVRLGDVTPKGRMRLDAIARVLQDVGNDDANDAVGGREAASWVVRRTTVVAEQFPVFREELSATTWASGAGGRWAERRTTITGASGARVEAAALWVYVDFASGRPRKLDPWFWEAYGESVGDRQVTARVRHSDAPPAAAVPTPWPLRFADFDLVGHVNNAVYWAMVEEFLHVTPGVPAEVEYRGGLDRDHDVSVLVDGDGLWIIGNGTVAATARVDQATA